jgi:hypothetical protein
VDFFDLRCVSEVPMIFKLAILTAIFYIVLGFVIEASLYVTAFFMGGATISSTRGGWWVLFGVIWLVAFSVAWHFAPISPAGLRR